MYKKKVLKNGLRMILAPLQETKTANILALFRVGSRYESKKLNGASHFVEHMMFKGTKKRPNTLELSKVLDGVGAEYNAFTDKDYTGYYIKADNKHLQLAIDVISDMLLESKFDEKEVEREKGVIVEEINMYEDNPLLFVEENMHKIMYENNPLGMLIAGSKESVKGVTRNELFDYKNKMYSGKNAVICLTGNFLQKEIDLLEKKLSLFPAGTKNNFRKFSSDQKKPRLKLDFKDSEQVQICLGFPAYSYSHKKNIILQMLSIILGGNMSSRLFLSVRERQGLAYYIHSSVSNFEDTGSLHVQAGLDKSRIFDAIKLIWEELNKISKGVKAEELQRAKDFISGKIAISLEDSSSLARWYALQELMIEKILTPEERIKEINRITTKEIAEVAKELIIANKLNLAVIGPFKEEKKFRNLIESL